jgi:transposase
MNQMDKELKQRIVEWLMPPNEESVSQIARESGISETTLYKWKKAALAQGLVKPDDEKSSERWSTREKLTIVVETASEFKRDRAIEYCRVIGLYVEQVAVWRDAYLQASRLQKELRAKDQ